MISAGHQATCGVTAEGAVKCWGRNDNGHLGVGLDGDVPSPTAVSGLDSGVVSVSTSGGYGGMHSCALKSSGAVLCWGDNTYGQLGIGSDGERLVPTLVPGLEAGAVAITTGGCKSCALTADGVVLCWGWNECDDDYTDTEASAKRVPARVPGLNSNAVAVSAGGHQTCAIDAKKAVWCWGLDFGSKPANPVPVARRVAGLQSDVVAISLGGLHACALTSVGGVWCWGDGSSSQIPGTGTTSAAVPVPPLDSGIVAISAGWRNNYALPSSGGMLFWGLQDGSYYSTSYPQFVHPDMADIKTISSGYSHSCGFTADGIARCWGKYSNGELGCAEVSNYGFVCDKVYGFP